ncbi:MAG: serpin family protein [Victivallaceae bacterium]|nr:serpin family protein [Victivallaceae bacterium]
MNKRRLIFGMAVMAVAAAAAVAVIRLLPGNAPEIVGGKAENCAAAADAALLNAPSAAPSAGIDLALRLLAAADHDAPIGCVSPLTLVQNMAMIYGGSGGATRTQLASVFNFAGDPAQAVAMVAGADRSLLERCGGKLAFSAVVMADGERARFRSGFLKLLADWPEAAVEPVDFSDVASSCAKINDWCRAATRGLIESIVSPDDVSDLSFAVFMSALYFRDRWTAPFDDCGLKPFVSVPGGAAADIPFMTGTAARKYAENDAWIYLELGFTGSPLNCVLVLPKTAMGADALIGGLNGGEFTQLGMAAQSCMVTATVPKFKVENTLDCMAVLRRLGMTDFGCLEPMAESRLPLEIGMIRQKNYFDFNLEGVEAASVTGSMVAAMSLPPPLPRKEFIADRPFLWFLYDNSSRTVLFAGWFAGVGE